MPSTQAVPRAGKSKHAAALSSVVAAVALTGMKLVVGLLTNSLGILAEAAHSALDLGAALMTLFAVRVSDKPADRVHPYGHGKAENLSALFETLLLLVTCVWIFYEAGHRLIRHEVDVEVNFWSFAVMIISIAVDVSRSRMLYRAAREHNSQALEADALHFSTDIWSSAVVILGLVGVAASRWSPRLEFLHHADAVSAILVALIVVQVSFRLGMRSIQCLLDAAPEGMQERIKAIVESIEGVTDCHHVRVRYSGPQMFADIHITMDGREKLERVHALTDLIEEAIAREVPNVDVTVHPEPRRAPADKAGAS